MPWHLKDRVPSSAAHPRHIRSLGLSEQSAVITERGEVSPSSSGARGGQACSLQAPRQWPPHGWTAAPSPRGSTDLPRVGVCQGDCGVSGRAKPP